MPQQIHWAVRSGQWEEAESSGLKDCIECGCCDFVCPSHIPLVEWFRHGKSGLRDIARERSRADHARERFEAREERLVRIKQERRQRIAEKKNALQNEQGKKADIAAAIARAKKKQEQKQ